jgi:plastocyanin
MQKFTASALLISALAVPALAQYGGSSGSSSSMASVTSTMAATNTASGSSATHTVQVGASGFVYSPDSVTAAKGDILEFHFTGTNLHDVVQGTFSNPCSNNDGIYSGYPSTSDVFQVMVNSTDPMWMYCSTPGHCQGGMAMVVNQA